MTRASEIRTKGEALLDLDAFDYMSNYESFNKVLRAALEYVAEPLPASFTLEEHREQSMQADVLACEVASVRGEWRRSEKRVATLEAENRKLREDWDPPCVAIALRVRLRDALKSLRETRLYH